MLSHWKVIITFFFNPQVFGADIVDAWVEEDSLVIEGKYSVIEIYSLPWIIKNCTVLEASLGQVVKFEDVAGGLIRTGTVGEEGFEIPYTIKFTGILYTFGDVVENCNNHKI